MKGVFARTSHAQFRHEDVVDQYMKKRVLSLFTFSTTSIENSHERPSIDAIRTVRSPARHDGPLRKKFPPRQFRLIDQQMASISTWHFAIFSRHTAQSISILLARSHITICRTRYFRITILFQKTNCCCLKIDFPVSSGSNSTHTEPK